MGIKWFEFNKSEPPVTLVQLFFFLLRYVLLLGTELLNKISTDGT